MPTALFRVSILVIATLLTLPVSPAQARRPIRKAFFNVYPGATASRLDDLPSNAGHCGVCHFDFDGGGPRNPYGLSVEVAIGSFPTTEDAILSLDGLDADNDGFINNVEITDVINFTNTPTFPGLESGNVGTVANVDPADILPHLTPSGSSDTTPPVVTVLSPNGGGNVQAGTFDFVTWSATDASGISHVDIYLSDDFGGTFKQVAAQESNDGTFDWFVPNRPGGLSAIRVVARDNAGNYGEDLSDGPFTITRVPGGTVPTTMRDIDLPGSQPFSAGVFRDPDVDCVTCHGEYDPAVEPWYVWKGSMMAQAQRDPLFLATVVVAEQDAPSVGDLCIRCHTPGGWLEGRSVDTSGALITAKDRAGVQCDFCHRQVDPIYKPGISPPQDVAVLDSLDVVPLAPANGQYVVDPDPIMRGPFGDVVASHSFLESPFHRAALCGTCHDVSNPVFSAGANPGQYVPNAFDEPHPDGDLRNMFPVERTFSEWSESEYAASGVFAPQFAGNKADGIVSTCQDCHMRDVSGVGCDEPGVPTRPDLPLHDLSGANHFVPDILPSFWGSEVDSLRLQDGKQRALHMLGLAATMALTPGQQLSNPTVTVTVTNETGHKLPSGYPEGRRIWLGVKAFDADDSLVYESGAYNPATGVLNHDADLKIYRIKPGVSTALAPVVGLPAAPSFHFVLNDTIYSDNRIPPRGYNFAAFEAIQSPPVGYIYPDGQYWDETEYVLPLDAVFAEVTLYYQTTSKGYIEFLRDENTTNTLGQQLYDAWVAQGRAAPVVMVTDTTSLHVDPTGIGDIPTIKTALLQNWPNPFRGTTTIRYALGKREPMTIRIYDVAGRLVKTLVNEARPEGFQTVIWDGTNQVGQRVASGVYYYRMKTATRHFSRKIVLLR